MEESPLASRKYSDKWKQCRSNNSTSKKMFKRVKTHCRYSLVSVCEPDVSELPETVEALLETVCWIWIADVVSLLALVSLTNIEKQFSDMVRTEHCECKTRSF